MYLKLDWRLFSMVTILLFWKVSGAKIKRYRFQLDLGKDKIYCPNVNYTCKDGNIHFLCKGSIPCEGYRYIQLTDDVRNMFIGGHNGVRNKIAFNWNIANMNIVHWSRVLEKMSQAFLEQCSFTKDTCLLLGKNNLQVNQNFVIRKNLPSKNYAGGVVRKWYLEIGFLRTYDEYRANVKHNRMLNFTQMIWPTLEFIGCGAAYYQNSYMVVCYYFPSYINQSYSVVEFGKPCTKCSRDRNICSLNFLGLCGIDIDLHDAVGQLVAIALPLLFTLLAITWFYNYLFYPNSPFSIW